jgi:hypothetical protein
MPAIISSLTEQELAIVREAEAIALAALDEDALIELHTRVRSARNKYKAQYRRRGAEKVGAIGGRGKAWQQNQRRRDKVEVFETALARVSTALAKAARRSAAELKAERLAAAREAKNTAAPGVASSVPRKTVAVTDPPGARKSAGRLKREASDIAVGRQKQAKKDARGEA